MNGEYDQRPINHTEFGLAVKTCQGNCCEGQLKLEHRTVRSPQMSFRLFTLSDLGTNAINVSFRTAQGDRRVIHYASVYYGGEQRTKNRIRHRGPVRLWP